MIAHDLGSLRRLYRWVAQEEVDLGERPGTRSSEHVEWSRAWARIRELEAELELTRKASAVDSATKRLRHRDRPREEWIAIPVAPIIDRDTFERASRDNTKWNPRGAEPGAWLLRGLIECGHCHVGCNCHKLRGRNGTFHRYYYCRNHDLLRAGGEDRRCPERNIRANELGEYVFQQVRQAHAGRVRRRRAAADGARSPAS